MASEVTGLHIGSRRDTSSDEVIALTQRADELGYDTVWVGESWGWDVFTVLTMIACHTQQLRLGTGIATVFSRSPAMTAQSIASLDVISKGRATLGLGTSGRLVIEEWHGVKYEKPIQRTREYVEIIRQALSGQRVNHQGELFQLGRFRLPFSPVQQPIPIYIASLGPKNLELTGEVADGWLPTWPHVGHLPEMIHDIEMGAMKAGRGISDIAVAPSILCYVTRNAEEDADARRLLSDHMAYYIGGMGTYYYDLFTRYGYGEECQRIKEAWTTNDRSNAASMVSQDMLDNITITGDADRCREQLQKYRDNGATMPVVNCPHDCEPDAILRTLEALAPAK